MRRLLVLKRFYSLEVESWLQTNFFAIFADASVLCPILYDKLHLPLADNVYTVKLLKVLCIATIMGRAKHDGGCFH